MKLGTQKDFPLIPAGEHLLKLANCDVVEFDDKYGNAKAVNGKVERLKWKFVSNETDDDGTPYDYVVYTGMDNYGNPKAGLTLLVDMLVPGMTEEAFADFDTDNLIGKKYRCQIKHVKKEDGSGMKAVHVYMTPAQSTKPGPKTPPKAAVTEEDLSDPFEEDGEFQKAA